jgi:hypothetical protein
MEAISQVAGAVVGAVGVGVGVGVGWAVVTPGAVMVMSAQFWKFSPSAPFQLEVCQIHCRTHLLQVTPAGSWNMCVKGAMALASLGSVCRTPRPPTLQAL